MANPIALFVDGLVSAVVGYAVAAVAQAFVATFETLNTPWYFIALYVLVIVIALAAEVLNHVVGSLAYAAGFLYGAYTLHDWVPFVLVLILTILVVYSRASNDD